MAFLDFEHINMKTGVLFHNMRQYNVYALMEIYLSYAVRRYSAAGFVEE